MLLKVGSKGDDVKKLQEKLGTTADGSFGPGTEKLVKEWQAANGLTADGIVGPGTWTKMFDGEAPVAKPAVVIPPSEFKLEALKGHIPDAVIAQIPDTAKKFNITNPLRLAHFLAQCGHESGGFKAVSENLNYSAKGLLGTFPKYFNATTAAQYERKPEMIASRVYGGRMGNGDEASKEGFKFRGRGYIQLTGKSNYTNFTKFIGEDIIFFKLLKETGVKLYAHTGALVTHMKTFPFDISYYALFWTAYNQVQDSLKKDDLCPSCDHKPSDVVKDCKCCNRGEDNE